MWIRKVPSKGDHIRISRMGGAYSHHGIYVNNDRVICYSGEPFKQKEAMVIACSLEDFIKGPNGNLFGIIEVNDIPAKYSADIVIQRAESRLGEQNYNLVVNNCEHFANWCRLGESRSQQVEKAIDLTIASGLTLVGMAIHEKMNKNSPEE